MMQSYIKIAVSERFAGAFIRQSPAKTAVSVLFVAQAVVLRSEACLFPETVLRLP